MKILPQRGAIPITLGDPARTRTLFFSMAATWQLVEKYGVNFLAELYTIVPGAGGDLKNSKLALKSLPALRYFLWAGLQEEISDTGETLTEEQAGEFLRPWTFTAIFNAVVMAVTGATANPALPGKAVADGAPASPSAAPAGRKGSTSKRRKGSTAER